MGSKSPPTRASAHTDPSVFQPSPATRPSCVSPGVHVVTDARGVIQTADAAMAAMMKVSPRDLVGQWLPDVLAPHEGAAFQRRLRLLEDGAPGLEWEMTLAPQGLRHVFALLTITALRESSGHIASVHWVIRDIATWNLRTAGDQALQMLGEHVHNGLSLSRLLSRLCEDLIQLFPFPLIRVATREDGALSMCAPADPPWSHAERTCRAWTSEERRELESVLGTRTVLHRQEERVHAEEADGERYPSRLLLPLCARECVAGVLVISGDHRETFDDRTIQWFEQFARRVAQLVAMHQAMTASQDVEARVFHLAHYDPLTDLPNRTLLGDRLTQALAHARRHGQSVGVLFVDLDRFKFVNDSLGHEAGDALLKIVADRLTRCVRATDTVARLSGDEFVVILQDLHHEQDAGLVAQHILDAVARPATWGHQRIHVTASVGIAVSPFNAAAPDALMAHADRAMYRAKERGGHCCQFVSEAMNEQAMAPSFSAENLRQAWERGDFFLQYQPEVDIRSGRALGIEALLRWQHPTLGVMGAARFVSMAEGAEWFQAMQAWVMTDACRQSRAWSTQGWSSVPVSVNVSLGHVDLERVLTMVRRAITDTALDPHAVRLEISESAARLRQRDVRVLVTRLLDLGVESVLDDVVYDDALSSFLQRLPFRRLKLASSLVVAASDNPDSDSMKAVERCLAVGRTLGVSVVAKGVESSGHVAALRERGCCAMQGYWCARPLSAEDMTTFLWSGRSLVSLSET